MFKAFLFDLDGTLLDTAPDLTLALNQLRALHNLPPVSVDQIRPIAGIGANFILTQHFDMTEHNIDELRPAYFELYRHCLHTKTNYFDGMHYVLTHLENRKITWGIVTNKPTWLTEPLLKKFDLLSQAACVVCGDTLPERKPHPAPLFHAAALINRPPEDCLFIGDSVYDITAGHRAGMTTCLARYGYIPHDEDCAAWGANHEIAAPEGLLGLLEY